MSRWLCIEAAFLARRYHGRGDDGRIAEWPPNPHRLFQALIAAANLGFRRNEAMAAKVQALRWLEHRGPPEIIAPAPHPGNVIRLYVPNNDMDRSTLVIEAGKPPSALRTGKDLHPQRVPGDSTVRFLWPIGDAEWQASRPHAELLVEEARHLHCLGLGIDLVAGNGRILTEAEKVALPGEVYVVDLNDVGWRTPDAGSLDELTVRHAETVKRVRAGGGRGASRHVAPPSPPRVWREVGYRRRAEGRERICYAFSLADEAGDARSFDPRQAIEVAAWLRHAAHLAADRLKLDKDFVEGFVCGHGEDVAGKNDRFSYLPLPTIAPKGRDGRIRRVLVAEPFGGGGGKARAVARRLGGAPLVEEGTGETRAELAAATGDDGVFRHYLPKDGARTWGTVTPMVLPGRDDRRSRKAVGLVLNALAQAGYATPVAEVTLQAAPVFPGQEMAGRYRVPEYLRPYPRTHAIVTFAGPVFGPLAIGGGRHVGLGVMAALE